MVFSECYSVTKSRHDAEDAAQATFLTLAVQARTGDEIRHLGPWLQRVARRVALDQEKAKRRRRKREDNHHRVNGSSGLATPERLTMDQLELRHVISEELQELPARYRMPLVLHYFGGLTRDQMAKELKCKPATLGVRLFRAREMLGKRLAKRGVMLPAVAIPIAIAMVVRESVEQHGILSMAASAHQIAQAASHVAAGLPLPSHAAVSPVSMAMADHAAKTLVLRKVKAIIAAAAIGASALAAGSAEVVRKIQNGQITIPAIFDVNGYFRFLKSPDLPQMRVDASQAIDGPQLAMADVRSGESLGGLHLLGPGHLELDAVSLSDVPTLASPANAVASGGGASGVTAKVGTARADAAPSAAGRGADAEAGGQAVASAAPANGRVGPEAGKTADVDAPAASAAMASTASDGSQNNPLAGATSLGGGGGGGGGAMSSNVFVLSAIPPLSSTAQKYGAPGQYFGSSSASSLGSSHISSEGGVLRGYGKVAFSGTFDMNGVVIADGYGQQQTLDLTSVTSVTHTVANAPAGINGWYAQRGAKLVLPAVGITRGTSSFTWGDDQTKTTLDLVNTARVTIHDAAADGTVAMSLLAPDREEVPAVPSGYDVLTIWGVQSSVAYRSLDITARYGLAGSDLTAPTSGLNVYYYDGKAWHPADGAIDVAHRLITADDVPSSAFLALFTTHGKANSGLDAAGVTGGDADAGPAAVITDADATSTASAAAVATSTSVGGVVQEPLHLADLDTPELRAAYAATLCAVSVTDAKLAATDLADSSSFATSVTYDSTDVTMADVPHVSGAAIWHSPPPPSVVPEPGGLIWVAAAVPLLGRRRRNG